LRLLVPDQETPAQHGDALHQTQPGDRDLDDAGEDAVGPQIAAFGEVESGAGDLVERRQRRSRDNPQPRDGRPHTTASSNSGS
jgi:hypothetical protein